MAEVGCYVLRRNGWLHPPSQVPPEQRLLDLTRRTEVTEYLRFAERAPVCATGADPARREPASEAISLGRC